MEETAKRKRGRGRPTNGDRGLEVIRDVNYNDSPTANVSKPFTFRIDKKHLKHLDAQGNRSRYLNRLIELDIMYLEKEGKSILSLLNVKE